jgi:hypothetical protein
MGEPVLFQVLAAASAASGAAPSLTADEIVQRSVAANEADRKAAPGYNFHEVDEVVTGGRTVRKEYEVI